MSITAEHPVKCLGVRIVVGRHQRFGGGRRVGGRTARRPMWWCGCGRWGWSTRWCRRGVGAPSSRCGRSWVG